jgi:hypothetical protein
MSAGFIPDDNWIPVNHAADLVIMRLAYALRAFLETCERDFCQRSPSIVPSEPLIFDAVEIIL